MLYVVYVNLFSIFNGLIIETIFKISKMKDIYIEKEVAMKF